MSEQGLSPTIEMMAPAWIGELTENDLAEVWGGTPATGKAPAVPAPHTIAIIAILIG